MMRTRTILLPLALFEALEERLDLIDEPFATGEIDTYTLLTPTGTRLVVKIEAAVPSSQPETPTEADLRDSFMEILGVWRQESETDDWLLRQLSTLFACAFPVVQDEAPKADALETHDYNVIAEAVDEFLGFDISTREQQDRITQWARSDKPDFAVAVGRLRLEVRAAAAGAPVGGGLREMLLDWDVRLAALGASRPSPAERICERETMRHADDTAAYLSIPCTCGKCLTGPSPAPKETT